MTAELTTSIGLVKDLLQQLITLAVGIVAFTVTFAKDFPSTSLCLKAVLIGCWLFYMLCIVAGVIALAMLTGAVAATIGGNSQMTAIPGNVSFLAGAQQILFGIATVGLIICGWNALR